MKHLASLLLLASLFLSCQSPQYYGSVIELIPEKEQQYRDLHTAVWPEVVAAIRQANIRDYRIYRAELQGKIYLFSTFTYVGRDFAADMASIAADETTRERWWPLTDACQRRIPGTAAGEQWMGLEQLMHLP
jgi:L-rhamnose mutarotase